MENGMTKEEYCFWLANLKQIGIRKIELLYQVYGSAKEIYHAPLSELETLKAECCPVGRRFGDADIAVIGGSRQPDKIHAAYSSLEKSGIHFISKEDETFPDKLRHIYDAPYALYVMGKLPTKDEKLIAIVGARESSAYGREVTRYLAGAVAKEGISVISGLARGIDAFAHEGALSVGGITYGVLGCGINICYPKENINMFMEMQQLGGVISEYAPGVKPLAGHFPMRNRIISGLCDGILVIEAKEKSGSLITADIGLEQGKEIYAVPGRISDQLSAGSNNLIKMGAKMVTNPKDIIEDFFPGYLDKQEQKPSVRIYDEEEKMIYSFLKREPKHIEEIAVYTKLPFDVLSEKLLLLELRGLVHQSFGCYCLVSSFS